MDKKKESTNSLPNILSIVKSIYVTNEIFSFLTERKKLTIFIYNKELQNNLDITIEDYKYASKRYKLIEDDGKGKEFKLNTNILIFEGEYTNGIKNGNGKEYYDNGVVKFEGEYLNGIKNGEGKEYYDNGKIKFEGEYSNTEKDGNGKEYYSNGKIKFEGKYFKGKKWDGKIYNYKCKKICEIKNGKGTIKDFYDNGKLKFEGNYSNGKKNGEGKEYYDNGKIKFEVYMGMKKEAKKEKNIMIMVD